MLKPAIAPSELFKSVQNPDFSAKPAYTNKEFEYFLRRGVTQEEQTAALDVFTQARSAVESGHAKTFLSGLSPETLKILQHVSSLADPIDPTTLSEEGAANLLLPEHEAVDYNNDGIVETGLARTVFFPPVNSPQSVKDAWDETIKGMSEFDILDLQSSLVFSAPQEGAELTILNTQIKDWQHADWNAIIGRALYINDLSRPQNTQAFSDKIASGLNRFLEELVGQGLA